jgi:hypothetical protein
MRAASHLEDRGSEELGSAWADPVTRRAVRRYGLRRATKTLVVSVALAAVYTLILTDFEGETLVAPASPAWLGTVEVMVFFFVVLPGAFILPIALVGSGAGLAGVGLLRRRLKRYPWRPVTATFGQINEKPFVVLAEDPSSIHVPYVFAFAFGGLNTWRRRARPLAGAATVWLAGPLGLRAVIASPGRESVYVVRRSPFAAVRRLQARWIRPGIRPRERGGGG